MTEPTANPCALDPCITGITVVSPLDAVATAAEVTVLATGATSWKFTGPTSGRRITVKRPELTLVFMMSKVDDVPRGGSARPAFVSVPA